MMLAPTSISIKTETRWLQGELKREGAPHNRVIQPALEEMIQSNSDRDAVITRQTHVVGRTCSSIPPSCCLAPTNPVLYVEPFL